MILGEEGGEGGRGRGGGRREGRGEGKERGVCVTTIHGHIMDMKLTFVDVMNVVEHVYRRWLSMAGAANMVS